MTLRLMSLTSLIVGYLMSFPAAADFDKGYSCFLNGDFDCAFPEFQAAVSAGDIRSSTLLGIMYWRGLGIERSETEAIRLLEFSGNLGERLAQYYLGSMYYNGTGFERNDAKAFEWFYKAALQGHAEAQTNVASMYLSERGTVKDDDKAFSFAKSAAEQGIPVAQNIMGYIYEYGRGVKPDLEQAIEWYKKAANNNDAEAQFNLALMFEKGKGVSQSYAEAYKWYLAAASQGFASAQANLGYMFEHGMGHEQNYIEALQWYKKAADQKDVFAQGQYKRLNELIGCNKSAKIKLFDEFIKCTNRKRLMAAVKTYGAKVKRENDSVKLDTYYSNSVLKDSSELSLAYTNDDKFAVAEYVFPSHGDTEQIARVRDFVATKYGKPAEVSGNVSLGEASFTWLLADGIVLKVTRFWPDTTTYLTYTYPPNNAIRLQELGDRLRKSREDEYSKQSDAF